MTRQISSLYRYPVKGLSAELLRVVQLETGCALPYDRQFAIAHCASKFNMAQPAWVARRNFAVRAYSPVLARLEIRFEPSTRTLTCQYDGQVYEIQIDSESCDRDLNQVLQRLNIDTQPGPYQLAEVKGTPLTDCPEPLISLMNTRSLQDLGTKMGTPLKRDRFRGNVWFDGLHPWEEREWCGSELSIGGVQVRVIEEIVRCRAIDVHPRQGVRDIHLLKELNGIYGHNHFGVLAEVLAPGKVSIGNSIKVLPPPPLGPLGI